MLAPPGTGSAATSHSSRPKFSPTTSPGSTGARTRRTERLFVDLRGAPEGLLPFLDQALERDPIARPASCGAIAEELRRMAAALRPAPPEPPAPSLPRWFWYALAAVIVVGAAVTLILAVL
jgi:hypothetical protein